jgi:hypothetical protein
LDREEYELFECRSDGSLSWRGLVRSLKGAQVTVWLLADQTGHQCFAMDSTATEIMLARTPSVGAKRIFQIAYGKKLAARAHLLQRQGFDVTSVSGNRTAKFVLRYAPPYDLFVIDDPAPGEDRLEMVHWLHATYPNTRILTLNPPQYQGFDELPYNAPSEPAGAWLPLVAAALDQLTQIS